MLRVPSATALSNREPALHNRQDLARSGTRDRLKDSRHLFENIRDAGAGTWITSKAIWKRAITF